MWIKFKEKKNVLAKKQTLGLRGEDLAAQYLCRHGYRIVARNYRTRFAEIDIVAEQHGVVCFVEVKTRKVLEYGEGVEAVSFWKQRKLSQAAVWYLREYSQEDVAARFDVLSIKVSDVGQPEFELFEDAFELAPNVG